MPKRSLPALAKILGWLPLVAATQFCLGQKTLGELNVFAPINASMSCRFELRLASGKETGVPSIVSKEPRPHMVKENGKADSIGEVHLTKDYLWTKTTSNSSKFPMVQVFNENGYQMFTTDPGNKMLVEPQGLIYDEGQIGFFPGEVFGRCTFGNGPMGSGYSWREVLNGYEISTKSATKDGWKYFALGPKPYTATVLVNRDGTRVNELTFESNRPEFVFLRRERYTRWERHAGVDVPVEGTIEMTVGSPPKDGQAFMGEKMSGSFTISAMEEGPQPAPPMQDGMTFFKLDKNGSKPSAFKYVNGKFSPSTDPGLEWKRHPNPYLYPGIGCLTVAGLIGFIKLRKKGVSSSHKVGTQSSVGENI